MWGTSPSPTGGDLHASEADSPPSSHWDYKYKTSTPSVHSADSEDTLADFLDVKLETSSSTAAVGVRRKRRKSKSPKFTVGILLLSEPRLSFVTGGDQVNGQGSGAACHHDGH